MSRQAKRTVQVVGRLTVNKLAKGMLKSGIYIPPFTPDRVILVEHKGRKSGIVRTTPMGFVRRPKGVLWVVAEHGSQSDWVKNALHSGVRVWLGKRVFDGTVRVLESEDPVPVWRQMKSRMLVAMARTLAHKPKVLEISLSKDQSGPSTG
ncbi:MAG TPA: nitroreductase family deazaflavin-dependent oxidoreductase [Actinomycetota bacterium]|nr:nitroreductase family deazaflavin-dependent oxidoreductase [Actinomycetota bacterium]